LTAVSALRARVVVHKHVIRQITTMIGSFSFIFIWNLRGAIIIVF
jgi:hypothetical protein